MEGHSQTEFGNERQNDSSPKQKSHYLRSFLILLIFLIHGTESLCQPVPRLALSPDELARRREQIGTDPVGLLLLLGHVEGNPAQQLREQLHRLFQDKQKESSRKEWQELGKEVARIIPTVLHTPQEVEDVLGDQKTIHRQLLYRRHLEQWRYLSPFPLVITFEAPRGQEPTVRNVQLYSGP